MVESEVSDENGNFPDPPTRGGARPNSGPKKPGYKKPQAAQDFDKAKARKETALADLHELDYRVKSGQYVSRVSVKQATATIMAALAQGIRSLPDNLERRGIEPKVCLQIDAAITEALADTGKALETLWQTADNAELPEDYPDDNSDLF